MSSVCRCAHVQCRRDASISKQAIRDHHVDADDVDVADVIDDTDGLVF